MLHVLYGIGGPYSRVLVLGGDVVVVPEEGVEGAHLHPAGAQLLSRVLQEATDIRT